MDDILFVVNTERVIIDENGTPAEAIRLISARLATSFERGVYFFDEDCPEITPEQDTKSRRVNPVKRVAN